MPDLEIRNLHVRAGDNEILRGLELNVGKGEIHALMGPNGSGKSTLANAIMGHPGLEVTDGLREAGLLIANGPLHSVQTATTVRVRDGVPAVTDGPYVEAKEFLAGYYVMDCETSERAEELAAMIPDARFAGIEVRPVMDSSGMEM